MEFAAIVVLGYLLGSCPWGYWIPLLVRHEDVREGGSGNVGASNVFRVYGTSLGAPVIFLDFAKGFVPALLGLVLVSPTCGVVAAAAAMVGHWRPLFLRFARGGKMVATGGGALFALAPLAALTGLALWIVMFVAFRYASIASLVVAAFVPFGVWAYGYPTIVVWFGVAAFFVVLFLHRANVARLWKGTENRSTIQIVARLRTIIS